MAARAGTAYEIAPCKFCGGPKPAGQGRKYCDACRGQARVRKQTAARAFGRKHYARNRERIIEQNRRWAEANPERVQESQRLWHEKQKASGTVHRENLRKKGLTVEQYEAMLEAQDGVCAICGGIDVWRRLSVDHNHATGEIRGLLCSGCNSGKLGGLGDSLDRAEARAIYHEERARRLRNAIEYLKSPPARQVLGDDHGC